MIKTQILLWKTIGYGLGLRSGLIYFILTLSTLTRDLTCSWLSLDGKYMRRKCLTNNLQYNICFHKHKTMYF